MTPYVHSVQYYETDKMGITHHSNYVRWMEEARVDFLSQIGWDFAKMEEMGIASPVLSVSCEYKKPTVFYEKTYITVKVKEFKGVKLFLEYEMKNGNGDLVCLGTSSHAFFGTDGRPVRMKQDHPDLYKALSDLVSE